MAPKLMVLYSGDYISPSDREVCRDRVRREMNELPGWEVEVAAVVGPFEDVNGHDSFFDACKKVPANKRGLALKRDFLTSIIQALRAGMVYKADFIVGEGQGGIIAAGMCKSLAIEVAMAAINVQSMELHGFAQAWSRLKGVVIRNPKLWRTESLGDQMLQACPEWRESFPVDAVPAYC